MKGELHSCMQPILTFEFILDSQIVKGKEDSGEIDSSDPNLDHSLEVINSLTTSSKAGNRCLEPSHAHGLRMPWL